jgi:two-component system, chemotaxis family, CheB/CheR fusion protein
LVLDWQESGLSDLPKPSRRGFGRELIEKALRFTLKAKAELSFGSEGVSCHIELPLPPLTKDEIASHV